MARAPDHRLKAVHPALVWFYRIYRNVANPFYIAPIRTLRCHRNQCPATRALLAKGKSISKLTKLRSYIVYGSYHSNASVHTHTQTHMFLDWYRICLKCFILYFFWFSCDFPWFSFLLSFHIEHVSIHLLPILFHLSLSLSGISLLSPSFFLSHLSPFCCTIPFYGDCEHLSYLICPPPTHYPLHFSILNPAVPLLPCLLDISQSNYVYLDSFCDTLESNFSDWLS